MAIRTAECALGAAVHSGWALVVVAGGAIQEPVIKDRRRIELISSAEERFVHPYHVAATLGIESARKHIDSVALEARKMALAALREVAADSVKSCAIVSAKAEKMVDLVTTLRSHAMIHAAEGKLFRDSVADAAAELGLKVFRFPENAIFETAAEAWNKTPTGVEKQIAELRRKVGPPWRRDEKLATLAALLACGSHRSPQVR